MNAARHHIKQHANYMVTNIDRVPPKDCLDDIRCLFNNERFLKAPKIK